MFTSNELTLLHDALDKSIAANKSMRTRNPQFAEITDRIDNELRALKIKINQIPKTK